MRRRRALQLAGGALVGTLAGCASDGPAFETYHYERDAPVDGPAASPWPTLAHDSRRSSHAPNGWLPWRTEDSLFAVAGQQSKAQPSFVDGTAYFGGRRPEYRWEEGWSGPSGLRTVDANRTGWFFAEDNLLTSPTVVGNAVFVTSSGVAYALDRRDGTLCWTYREGSSYPTASPTVVDGTVYILGNRVYALDARTGGVQWATDRLRFNPRGTAATSDGVFATTGREGQGAVYRFDPETGTQEWVASTSGDIPVPPVLDELVYILGADGRLRALNPFDGREVWSHQLDGRSSAMPAVAEEIVYAVATNGDTLTAIDAFTGEVRWEFPFDGRLAMGPTTSGSVLYLPLTVGGGGGVVLSILTDSGSLLWSHGLSGPPTSPLVLGGGTGLISTKTSASEIRLYRLTLPRT